MQLQVFIFQLFKQIQFFQLFSYAVFCGRVIETVMEINSLRGFLSTITDIVFFLWNRHGRRALIFFHATSPFFLLLLCS